MRIRPAYVKCDAVTGTHTVHHQVGPVGRQGELHINVLLKDIGKSEMEQVEVPRVSISDTPNPDDSLLRTLEIKVDGYSIYKEIRRAYE